MNTTQTQSLTAESIKEKILSAKGNFIKAYWKSNPSPAAKHKNVILEKVTSAVVRAGIDYSNLSAVNEAINNGERGEVESLPWGEWKSFPYIITHKGNDYIRLYPSDGNNHYPKSKYIVDGIEVDKETFASYLTPSNANKLLNPEENHPLCFTIKEENVIGAEEYNDA